MINIIILTVIIIIMNITTTYYGNDNDDNHSKDSNNTNNDNNNNDVNRYTKPGLTDSSALRSGISFPDAANEFGTGLTGAVSSISRSPTALLQQYSADLSDKRP